MIEKENDMTIDTLQIYEQLRSSSLPDEAAKGIANVIKLELTKLEINREIEKSKDDLRRFMALMFILDVVVVAALVKFL